MESKLFIGMPVYNGEKFISKSIESLIKQTYKNWILLISDNDSNDGTRIICEKLQKQDPRIEYFKHKKNIGAIKNFEFVLNQAKSKYFMWAAADDIWEPEFLNSCIKNIEKSKNYNMAFCNIVNIDSFDRVIRYYDNFQRFHINNDYERVASYIIEPEILGKANLIYSIFKIEFCKKIWKISPLNNNIGSDMSFVLAAICKTNINIDEKILFKKRIVRKTDTLKKINIIKIDDPYKFHFSSNEFNIIRSNYLKIVKKTKFFTLVKNILNFQKKYINISDLLTNKKIEINRLINNKFYKFIFELLNRLLSIAKKNFKKKK